MSVGLGLLGCVITGKKTTLGLLDEFGISRKDFVDNELKVYDYVRKYFTKFGKLPELTTVTADTKVKFPAFPQEPIEYWIQRVEERRHAGLVMDASEAMKEAVSKGDVETARTLAKELYRNIGSTDIVGRVYYLQALADDVLKEHDRAQMATGLSGISFGIPYLNEVSGGAQPGDSIAIVGNKGSGKTFLTLVCSLSCYDQERVPLLGTFEMPALQMARRMMALRGNVTAMAIRLGKLSHWARKKLESTKSQLKKGKIVFPIFEGTLKTTVDDIVSVVQEIRPAALYIDGAYLLRVKGKYMGRVERVSEVAETLKMIAKDFHIPVFGTYQFARRGRGLEQIGWSDIIGQLASIVISIRAEDAGEEVAGGRYDQPGEYRVLELLKGREGERGKVRITFDMNRMKIEQHEILEGYSLPDEKEERNG